jgi:orotidine-5'-phosphate decarboxylase
MDLLEVLAPIVPAVKPQSAYFEALGPDGVAVYHRVVAHARQLGLIVIGDVKRSDIGSTAGAYARGHLARPDSPDAITVNPYFGADGLEPFVEQAVEHQRGVFVLVRTSNPSAGEVQDATDETGMPLYRRVGEMVRRLGAGPGRIGEGGLSCVGAVVGATWPAQARQLRSTMPEQVFLVPGYGAQGASADDCAAAFNAMGAGALVNASRSVIYAFTKSPCDDVSWTDAVAGAARAFADDIRQAVRKHRPHQANS